MEALTDKGLAAVRTLAAVVAGLLITWVGVHLHIVLSQKSSELVKGETVAVAAFAYNYAVVWLQHRWPVWSQRVPLLGRFQWLINLLLISSRVPTYAPAHRPGGRRAKDKQLVESTLVDPPSVAVKK